MERTAIHAAWVRRLRLLGFLMRKGFAQTADAARYLDVDRRTALADLTALEKHDVPLRAHPEDTRDPDRTWELMPSWRTTGVDVTLNERLALLLGREVLEPLIGGSELGLALSTLEHELASFARGVEGTDQELLRRFHFIQEPSKSYAAQGPLVSELVGAIAGAYRVTLDYHAATRAAPRSHARACPLTLVIYRRGLYVFVKLASGRIVALSVDRIGRLAPHHDDPFDYPTRGKWDPARHLASRFGLHPGKDGVRRVRLRFEAASRAYAIERRWMPDQVVEERPDGGVDVVFDAEGDELAYRILEWGEHCEVVEPPALRARVLELARAVVRRYEAGPA